MMGGRDDFHPFVLATKANAEDNPQWHQAMNGPNADGYWDAMARENETLEQKEAWQVVDTPQNANVLDST